MTSRMTAGSVVRLRRVLKSSRRAVVSGIRAGLRHAVAPIYQLLLRSALLRKCVNFTLKRAPWLDRFLFRSLANIGFLPSIAAEMAEVRGRSLVDGGADFTQAKPPARSYRAAGIAASLQSHPRGTEGPSGS